METRAIREGPAELLVGPARVNMTRKASEPQMGSNQYSSRRYLDFDDPEIHRPIYLNRFNTEIRVSREEEMIRNEKRRRRKKLVTSYRQDKFRANQHSIRKVGIDLSEFVKDARRERVYVLKGAVHDSQDEDEPNFENIQAISVDEDDSEVKDQ